jgi:excisionase family DNA binding protein
MSHVAVADTPRLMTASELSEVLGVHPNYVYSKAKDGVIPSYKFAGVRRFNLSEVMTWLESQRA